MVSLRSIDESNREAVEALNVSPEQQRLVSKLFIGERYQGRGYGTATLDLIVDYFRRRPEVEVMRTSCSEGEGSPLGFYERYGFEQTGKVVFDNELLLQLKLR